MRVTALTLFPVKSLEGVALDVSALDARGLRGDRRWGFVDASGAKVTAREVKALLGLRAEPVEPTWPTGPTESTEPTKPTKPTGRTGAIRLLDRAGGSLVVAPPWEATPVAVDHSGQGTARPAGRS